MVWEATIFKATGSNAQCSTHSCSIIYIMGINFMNDFDFSSTYIFNSSSPTPSWHFLTWMVACWEFLEKATYTPHLQHWKKKNISNTCAIFIAMKIWKVGAIYVQTIERNWSNDGSLEKSWEGKHDKFLVCLVQIR